MDEPKADLLVEQGLTRIGFVVLILLFVLAPPPKSPPVLVLALLLAAGFLLQWAWPWARIGRLNLTISIVAILAICAVVALVAWPHPRLHLSDERVMKGPGGHGGIGVYVAFTNEGDDAYWYPYGQALVLPNNYDIGQTAQRFAACVRQTLPAIKAMIPLNSEDGLGTFFSATRVSNNDYEHVNAGKEVLYFAGEAVAHADGVTRTFPFCGVSSGGGMSRCAEQPGMPEPAAPACLSNPWATPAPPNPSPAPNPQ
jgi:hypothetical protein